MKRRTLMEPVFAWALSGEEHPQTQAGHAGLHPTHRALLPLFRLWLLQRAGLAQGQYPRLSANEWSQPAKTCATLICL